METSNEKNTKIGNRLKTMAINGKALKPIKINVKQFIIRLSRRVNTGLYYNKDCYTQLKPEELQSLPKLLFYFYKKRDKFESGMIKGVQSKVIFKELDLADATIRYWLGRLMPVVINMSFYKKKGGKLSRYYSLNDNGMILCERMLEVHKNNVSETDR